MSFLTKAGAKKVSPTGAAASDTAILQGIIDDAITNGTPAYIPSGTWSVNASITVNWSTANYPGLIIYGDGPNNTIIQRVGDAVSTPIFKFTQSTTSVYSINWRIQDLQLKGPSSSPAQEVGIEAKGVWYMKIQNCIFNDLDGDGIFVDSDATDGTTSNHWEVVDCCFWKCGEDVSTGYGFRVANKSSKTQGGNLPHLKFRNCEFKDCGGAFYGGLSYGGFDNCTFAYSTDHAQVHLTQHIGHMVAVHIDGCNFEGGEAGECIISQVYGAKVENSRLTGTFKAGNVPSTSFGFQVGDSSNSKDADNVSFDDIIVNYDEAGGTLTTFKAFDIQSNAVGTHIRGVFYSDFDAGYTEYTNSGGATTIWQRGGWIKPPGHTSITTGVAGTADAYTPDFTAASRWRFNVTDAGAGLTINNPTGFSESYNAGQPAYFSFFNSSGSALDFASVVSWGSNWKVSTVPSGASSWGNSTWITVMFVWDTVNADFQQVGDSSTI